MSKSLNRAIVISAIVYQAIKQFKDSGTFVIPNGYDLIKILSGDYYPHFGFILENKDMVVIALRGTRHLFDVISGSQYKQIPFPYVPNSGRTHKGLTNMYTSVLRTPIFDSLKDLNPSKKLVIAGHSIGGSLATLCTLDVSINGKFEQPILYTFGSPKIGNSDFVESFNNRITHSINIANRGDLVPLLPFSKKGNTYKHIKDRFLIGRRDYRLVGSHEIESYFKNIAEMKQKFSKDFCDKNPGMCPNFT